MKRITNQVCQVAVFALVVVSWHTPVEAQLGVRDGEWHFYGGDAGGTKYSSLDQIDESNVKDLQVAWRWKTDNFGPRPESYSRVTPIMVGGVLYATAGYRRAAVAIDAATGETLWTYRFDEGERGENAPRVISGLGVAYWTDVQQDERIFLVTPGYRLIALNAKTGRPSPDFGTNGIVDL